MGEGIFRINGFDIYAYIAKKGIKIKRGDIDSDSAGMALNGILRRDRVITRYRIDVTIGHGLKTSEIHKILRAIQPEWVNVEYINPFIGGVVMHKCYSNNVDAPLSQEANGVLIWDGFTFPLIEEGVPDT